VVEVNMLRSISKYEHRLFLFDDLSELTWFPCEQKVTKRNSNRPPRREERKLESLLSLLLSERIIVAKLQFVYSACERVREMRT
jgi:hypothetical protein